MNGIPVFVEDIGIIASGGSMRALGGSRVLLTGATGLLGGLITKAVLEHNRRGAEPISLILPVRDRERAERLWGRDGNIVCIERPVEEITAEDLEGAGDPDYVIHLASPTRSRFFVEHPVETLDTVIGGTAALLRALRRPQRAAQHQRRVERRRRECHAIGRDGLDPYRALHPAGRKRERRAGAHNAFHAVCRHERRAFAIRANHQRAQFHAVEPARAAAQRVRHALRRARRVALHGSGGRGRRFSRVLGESRRRDDNRKQCRKNGSHLVAPLLDRVGHREEGQEE